MAEAEEHDPTSRAAQLASAGWAELRGEPVQPHPDDGTRWLDDAETEAWVALSAMVAALPEALDSRLRRDAGLSLVEYQVLSWLSMTRGRTARMTVLAEMAVVSQSRLSRVATRLEARGFLRRTPDPDDGRGTLAELTDAGRDAVEAAAAGHVAQVKRLVFGRLSTSQVDQLGQLCAIVLEGARPGHCLRVPVRRMLETVHLTRRRHVEEGRAAEVEQG